MAQLQLTKQKHSESWVQMFTKDVTSVKGSLIFVKQFTALSFSIISYMRSIFPEIAYTEKDLDDVKVKILAGNYDCKDAYLMTKWIKSAFHALENKYMRELILEILSTDDSPLEYYAVGFKYTSEGPTCSLTANSNILNFDYTQFENTTKNLINNLLTITENLEPLPAKYKLQLRINYYDEGATPHHYKPKFFSHAKANDLEKLENIKRKTLGCLETPYHSISIYSGSALVALDESQHSFYIESETEEPQKIQDNEIPEKIQDNEITEKIPDKTDRIDVNVDSSNQIGNNATPLSNPTLIDNLESNTNWTWSKDKSASQDTEGKILMAGRTEAGNKLYCICSQDFDKDATFKCQHCDSFHHLVCYKISNFGKIPENGCCFACAKLDSNLECTDLTLMKYKPRQAKHLAIYRQTLYRCHGMKNITPKTLQTKGVPEELVGQMITKLMQENFIKVQNRSKNIYKVFKSKLAHFYKFYFTS